jgi:hypothetical protein
MRRSGTAEELVVARDRRPVAVVRESVGGIQTADSIVAAQADYDVEPVGAVHDVVFGGAETWGAPYGRWALDVQRVGGTRGQEHCQAYRGEEQSHSAPHPARIGPLSPFDRFRAIRLIPASELLVA